MISTQGQKERVVILGSGWAGYAFARTLDPKKFERIMISPRSYFVFTPLVAGTAVGTLEFRAVMESVRRLGLDHYHQGWADDVDFSRKVIRVEANTSDDIAAKTIGTGPVKKGAMFDVPYDKLVVAVGSYSQTFGIEGVKEHANFLRDVSDARKIRMKVLQRFEKAALPMTSDKERRKLLHFAVVGGGPTGIEFAAQLHDLVHDDLSKTYPDLVKEKDLVQITVYDVADKVLPMFDRKLAQYATDTFMRERIVVKTEHHLTRIRRDPELDGCLKLKITECGDEEVSAGLVVWSTGLMQNPLVAKLGMKTLPTEKNGSTGGTASAMKIQRDAKSGGLIIDRHLRVTTATSDSSAALGNDESTEAVTKDTDILPDVFSIGDCATVQGEQFPATAQVASQQASYLAKRLNKGDVDSKTFKYRDWGVMTYLGGWKAIHQSSADELQGWAAWVLWRTAYLTKSMSVRNKIMVPVYWVMSWLFGRDISRF
ncbi:pyridine nucleotide-disulfide oxidoreductase-domain-containing protein [Xylariaceae sp. FL1019]|nr:pyridine nucleotide-disulfide oxidoreductase-domain-containing protein [Xylariaceae sp. FL1019]